MIRRRTGVIAAAGGVIPAGLFVATTGSDSNPGTYDLPWLTLGFAFSQLGPGSVLWLRGGRYAGPVSLNVSGTALSPITVSSYPGEVAKIDASFPEFQTPGNNAWEIDPGAPGGTEVWRTPGTGYGTGANGRGTFLVDDVAVGVTLSGLHQYLGLSKLRATNYTWNASYDYYAGPGFAFDGGRIYIRMQNLASPRNAGVPSAATANPLGDLRNHPPSAGGFDPRDFEINLSNIVSNLTINGSHVQLKRLDVRGGLNGIAITNGSDDILIERCRIWSLRAIERLGSSDNIVARWNEIRPGTSPCFSWNELHTQGADEFPRMEGKAFSGDGHDCLFEENLVVEYFDGTTGGNNGLRWIRNTVAYSWDDMWQMGGSNQDMEAGWNFVGGSCVGYNGNGDDPTASKWFHHNIVGARAGAFGWRLGMEGANGGGPAWRVSNITFPTHSTGGSDTAAKITNNTIFHGDNTANDGCRIERQPQNPSGSHPTVGLHEAYNNISVQRDNEMYVNEVTVHANWPQKIDYNVIHRLFPGATLELFRNCPNGAGGQTHYATLAAWLGSSGFVESQSVYAPGYEANSKQADPQFPQATYDALWDSPFLDYRPSAAGPAASGAKDLSSSGFPGGDDAGYFGAVDPNAATFLGDVGIPPGTPIGPEGLTWDQILVPPAWLE